MALLHLHKLINTFFHNYPEKPRVIFPPINSALPMARSIAKPRARPQANEREAGLQKIVELANMLNKPEISVFISFLALF